VDTLEDFEEPPIPAVNFAALLSTVETEPATISEESGLRAATEAVGEAEFQQLAPGPPVSAPTVDWGAASVLPPAPVHPVYEAPAAETSFGEQVAAALERIAPGSGAELAPHQIPPPEFNDPDSSVTGFVMNAGRNAGKALALATPIPTPNGWSTVGSLDVGDWMFDECGHRTRITATFDVDPDRTVRLHFSDGTYIDACDEHRWVTLSSGDIRRLRRTGASIPCDWASRYDVIQTVDMIDGRDVIIPLAGALHLPDRDLPLDPYLLGFWLGNGVRGTSRVTCHNDDEIFLREQIARRTDFVTNERSRGTDRCADFSVRGLIHTLRALGVDRDKYVPSIYMRASENQRAALLAGLLDSDGHMSPRGSIEFSSIDESLALAVLELARSLGQRPTIRKGTATLYGVEKGPKYRVAWQPTVNPFQSPRKSSVYTDPPYRHYRRVVSHEILPPVPMRCFTVDSPNHMFLAGEGMIPTHNSYAGARWLHSVMTKYPRSRARIIAPSFGDAVASCIEGPSGILEASHYQVQWQPTYAGGSRLLWPNGSVCYVIGTPTSREVDRLRAVGNIRFDWIEEAAANTQLVEVERQARLSRRQKGAKWMATTTPRPLPTIRAWAKDPTVHISTATSHDNPHADPLWLAELESMYKGTRLYRQEVLGEVLEDVEGALWAINNLDRSRITSLPVFQDMVDSGEIKITRGAIGVDPGNTTGTTGIVTVLMSEDRHLYVVEDRSMPAASANAWAAAAVTAARLWGAPIVAENDSGGDAIRAVLKSADQMDEITIVPARAQGRGSKGVRAEPIALLWERDDFKGHIVGEFPMLEEQLATFVPEISPSPDRLDAMVWACTYLSTRAGFSDFSLHEPNQSTTNIRRPGVASPWKTNRKRTNRSNRVNQE
jgi:phage terminase large subunit-like protein